MTLGNELMPAHAKLLSLIVAGTLLLLGCAPESPEHREKIWREDPTRGLRRGWVNIHEDLGKKIRWSTSLIFDKDEVRQMVYRIEGKIGKDDESIDEFRIFRYSVRRAWLNDQGMPVVEIVLTENGAVWTAVLRPRENEMDLTKGGFPVGRYSYMRQ